MSVERVKDEALTLTGQFAALEMTLGRITGMVLEAAIHSRPGVAEGAMREINQLDADLITIQRQARKFRDAFDR